MACDSERQRMIEAYEQLQAAQAAHNEAWHSAEEALSGLERGCGYFNAYGEFTIDPLDPSDVDYEDPPCPERFADWLSALWDLGLLGGDLQDAIDDFRQRRAEFTACQHAAAEDQAPRLA